MYVDYLLDESVWEKIANDRMRKKRGTRRKREGTKQCTKKKRKNFTKRSYHVS